MIWMMELHKMDREEASNASLAISLDMSAQFILSLIGNITEKPMQRQWKHAIGFTCSSVWKHLLVLLWHFVQPGARQAQIHTRCGFDMWSLFSFSALFILQPQPVPVRCKIRSTRVAVSFCSLLIAFSSFHSMFNTIFQKIIERMVVQGSASSLLCGDCIFSVPISYSSHQFFLPQNMDMSKVKICQKIQFKIGSKISSRTIWANLKMCVVLCSDSCLLCNSPSGSFISCAASLHIWNLP